MVVPNDWLVACASRWNVACTSGVTEMVSRIRSGAFEGEGDFIGAVCTNLHQAVQGATTHDVPQRHEPATDQQYDRNRSSASAAFACFLGAAQTRLNGTAEDGVADGTRTHDDGCEPR